jgi:hypothetical protein
MEQNRKKYVMVPSSCIVRRYNQCMGRVDIYDQLMEAYRTFLKTKKWTLKVILHLIDLAPMNAWLEYKEDCRKSQIPKKNILDLLRFKMAIGETLVASPKDGRYQPTEKKK